jgi:hypothetical protein
LETGKSCGKQSEIPTLWPFVILKKALIWPEMMFVSFIGRGQEERNVFFSGIQTFFALCPHKRDSICSFAMIRDGKRKLAEV